MTVWIILGSDLLLLVSKFGANILARCAVVRTRPEMIGMQKSIKFIIQRGKITKLNVEMMLRKNQ